jgi:hypothetical protein
LEPTIASIFSQGAVFSPEEGSSNFLILFAVTTFREKQLERTQKVLHGKYAHALSQPYVKNITSNDSFTWTGLFMKWRILLVPSRTKWLTLKIMQNSL